MKAQRQKSTGKNFTCMLKEGATGLTKMGARGAATAAGCEGCCCGGVRPIMRWGMRSARLAGTAGGGGRDATTGGAGGRAGTPLGRACQTTMQAVNAVRVSN